MKIWNAHYKTTVTVSESGTDYNIPVAQIQYWANLMAAAFQISNTKWKQSHYIK